MATKRPLEDRGRLSGNLAALLESGDGADVTLEVGGARLRAHRAILAARSPLLRARLRERTPEAASRTVHLPEMEEEVARQLLHFMYTDRVPGLSAHADKLLVAAHEYGLPQLKQLCENVLVRGIHVDNASEMAVLAVKCSCTELKEASIHFIRYHNEVLATSGWENAIVSHPRLAAKICRLLVARPSKKSREEKAPREGRRQRTKPEGEEMKAAAAVCGEAVGAKPQAGGAPLRKATSSSSAAAATSAAASAGGPEPSVIGRAKPARCATERARICSVPPVHRADPAAATPTSREEPALREERRQRGQPEGDEMKAAAECGEAVCAKPQASGAPMRKETAAAASAAPPPAGGPEPSVIRRAKPTRCATERADPASAKPTSREEPAPREERRRRGQPEGEEMKAVAVCGEAVGAKPEEGGAPLRKKATSAPAPAGGPEPCVISRAKPARCTTEKARTSPLPPVHRADPAAATPTSREEPAPREERRQRATPEGKETKTAGVCGEAVGAKPEEGGAPLRKETSAAAAAAAPPPPPPPPAVGAAAGGPEPRVIGRAKRVCFVTERVCTCPEPAVHRADPTAATPTSREEPREERRRRGKPEGEEMKAATVCGEAVGAKPQAGGAPLRKKATSASAPAPAGGPEPSVIRHEKPARCTTEKARTSPVSPVHRADPAAATPTSREEPAPREERRQRAKPEGEEMKAAAVCGEAVGGKPQVGGAPLRKAAAAAPPPPPPPPPAPAVGAAAGGLEPSVIGRAKRVRSVTERVCTCPEPPVHRADPTAATPTSREEPAPREERRQRGKPEGEEKKAAAVVCGEALGAKPQVGGTPLRKAAAAAAAAAPSPAPAVGAAAGGPEPSVIGRAKRVRFVTERVCTCPETPVHRADRAAATPTSREEPAPREERRQRGQPEEEEVKPAAECGEAVGAKPQASGAPLRKKTSAATSAAAAPPPPPPPPAGGPEPSVIHRAKPARCATERARICSVPPVHRADPAAATPSREEPAPRQERPQRGQPEGEEKKPAAVYGEAVGAKPLAGGAPLRKQTVAAAAGTSAAAPAGGPEPSVIRRAKLERSVTERVCICPVPPVHRADPAAATPTSKQLLWQLDKKLLEAAKDGAVEEVRRLVDEAANVMARDEHKMTALHWAAGGGHVEVVRYLLSVGAEVHPRDRWQQTPLQRATARGRQCVVDVLLEASAHKKPIGLGNTPYILVNLKDNQNM